MQRWFEATLFMAIMSCVSVQTSKSKSQASLLSPNAVKQVYKENEEAFFARVFLARSTQPKLSDQILRLEILGLIKKCQVVAAQNLLTRYRAVLRKDDFIALTELLSVASRYQVRMKRQDAKVQTRTQFWPAPDLGHIPAELARMRVESLCPEVGG